MSEEVEELKAPYGRLLDGWRSRGSSSSGYTAVHIREGKNSMVIVQVQTSESEGLRRRPRQLRQMPMNERER